MFRFDPRNPSGKLVLEVKGLSKQFDGEPVLKDVTFTLGVRNLTDEEPPYVTAYDDMNTLQFSYDTQGRYIYGRASMSF